MGTRKSHSVVRLARSVMRQGGAVRSLAAGTAALLLLASCTSEPAGPTAPTPSGPAAVEPDDANPALMRATLDLRDPTRVTDPTPDSPGADADLGRDLPSTVLYPQVDHPLPVVVFTHGLGSTPEAYEELLSTWALAGFFVVAPSYPLTVAGSAQVFEDVASQPADVSFVLDQVLALDDVAGEPFEGRIDVEHVAVAGHSAGAITALGLLSSCCADERIDAAVVLAGSPLFFGGEIAATDVPTLFVHGTQDTVLPIAEARAVFDGDSGPAAFLELDRATHSTPFDDEADPHYPAVRDATTSFLQWSLLDDDAALEALRTIGSRWSGALLTGDRLTP